MLASADMSRLIDRERELAALQQRFARRSSLSLVFGQRRTGKTYLLQHALAGDPDALYFPADESTGNALLTRFVEEARAVARLSSGPGTAPSDWGTALTLLLQEAALAQRPLRLVIDECQYLLAAEPTFPSVLQRLWDAWRDRMALHVVLCGSALGALAALGDEHQPLYGRFDLRLKLSPFSYREAARFAPAWDARDRLLLYGVFGGLARHLAQVDETRPLAENVVQAILDPLATLHEAPIDILRSERLSSRAEADAVLAAIAQGEDRFTAIAARAGLSAPRTDAVLKELQSLELVRRDGRYGDSPGARYARYRVCDPLAGFWFRLVRPNRGAFQGTPPETIWRERIVPRLDDRMGLVMEEIARQVVTLSHRPEAFGIVDEAVPWWSRDGRTEIDLVVRSGDRMTFVECKWSAGRPLDLDALRRLRDHVARFPRERERREGRLCLVSAGGFRDRLRTVAAAEDVLLVDVRELLS